MSDKNLEPTNQVVKRRFFGRFGSFVRRNENLLMFLFYFGSLHMIWFNMQRKVPYEDRTEIKALQSIKTWWAGKFKADEKK